MLMLVRESKMKNSNQELCNEYSEQFNINKNWFENLKP